MQNASTQPTRWNSLDCLKGIACIAVSLIHFNWTGSSIPPYVGASIKAMCRFAVPVFLCISGFFLAPGQRIDAARVVKQLKRILMLFLSASCFYGVYTYAWNLLSGDAWEPTAYAAETITGDKVVKLFLTHDPFVYSHLWFLLALLCCYAFILLFLSGEKRFPVYALAPVLLIAYACMQQFKVLPTSIQLAGMESRIYLFNSFLFRALPFVLFGMIFRYQLIRIQRMTIKRRWLILLAIAGCLSGAIERVYFGECQFYIGSYVTAFAMMVCALQDPSSSTPILQHIGRDLSLYVYIFHIAVGNGLDVVARYAHFANSVLYDLFSPLIVIAGSLIFAELLFQCKKLRQRKTA